jgi:hypothetical protein
VICCVSIDDRCNMESGRYQDGGEIVIRRIRLLAKNKLKRNYETAGRRRKNKGKRRATRVTTLTLASVARRGFTPTWIVRSCTIITSFSNLPRSFFSFSFFFGCSNFFWGCFSVGRSVGVFRFCFRFQKEWWRWGPLLTRGKNKKMTLLKKEKKKKSYFGAGS